MASAVSNVADIQQQFMNNITQVSQQSCIATVTNQANNNVVIVNGTNIGGDFTGVSTTVSTDATCMMVSTLEDSVNNILQAILQQQNKSSTDWFNGFQITDDTNNFNINQSVVNNILQINESLCSANTTNSVSNNYVYVTNTTIGGNFVGVTDKADASANCTMTNTMKNVTYNQVQASASQSNIVQGIFGAILAAVFAVIAVITIGVIMLFALSYFGFFGGKKTQEQPKPEYPLIPYDLPLE